jgi:hypothetical protein
LRRGFSGGDYSAGDAVGAAIGCRQKEFGDFAASCYIRANDKIEQAPAAAHKVFARREWTKT